MRVYTKTFIAAVLIALSLFASFAAAAEVEVLWLGHSTVRITSTGGKVIVIDPFLKLNPQTPIEYRDLKALGSVDLILISHGHDDHISDLKELASLTGAQVVSPYAFAHNLVSLGILDADKIVAMQMGGTVTPIGRGIKVHMVPAEHESFIDLDTFGLQLRLQPADPNVQIGQGQEPRVRMLSGGSPVGYVVELENGFSIYHTGDTAAFGDMALIREFYKPDLALVCIGGHFTMDPIGAAYAVREFIKPKQVMPMHFGTFPAINRTPEEFKEALGDAPVEFLDVKPGQALKY